MIYLPDGSECMEYGSECPVSHPFSFKLGNNCCASTVSTCASGEMGAGDNLGFESDQCNDGHVPCGKVPCYNHNSFPYNTSKGNVM